MPNYDINPNLAGKLPAEGIAHLKQLLSLDQVTNTTAAAVNAATQTALNLKANLASPNFSGVPTLAGAPLATQAWVENEIDDAVVSTNVPVVMPIGFDPVRTPYQVTLVNCPAPYPSTIVLTLTYNVLTTGEQIWTSADPEVELQAIGDLPNLWKFIFPLATDPNLQIIDVPMEGDLPQSPIGVSYNADLEVTGSLLVPAFVGQMMRMGPYPMIAPRTSPYDWWIGETAAAGAWRFMNIS
jgi:hypothetical protein